MTLEEYNYYSAMATRLFNYMNGRINILNNRCTLTIDMHDYVNGTYGNIKFPSMIYIHIGTIVDSWDDDWDEYMDKTNYVASLLAWSISHELHHADQLISMLQYGANIAYRREKEYEVERQSYDWVYANSSALSQVCGVRIIIDELESPSLKPAYQLKSLYKKATVAEYYKQIIENTIIRDTNEYYKFKVFLDDGRASDIVLNFICGNCRDTIMIKFNGKYLEEQIPNFAKLAYLYSGQFDKYHLDIRCEEVPTSGKNLATVNFTYRDRFIYPMQFKN